METKTFILKDKSIIVIKDLSSEDFQNSVTFFNEIPESKRNYFRSDVTDKNHLIERAKESESGKVIRRIAEMDGKIVGDSSLAISSDSWKSSSAYLRMVVPKDQLGKGIQYAMAKDIFDIAHSKKLEKITTKFMRPQKDLMNIYTHLGFKIGGVLPNYVQDQEGHEQDMVVMAASLEELRSAHTFIGDWLDNEHSSVSAGEM
ncbi:MAG: GNAT family N-acetyltransferase [Candidatus Marinimicrobia bacterium]|jgi:L-amino acid N-acyltransferase YncA|nr:GNAT family N-acetyltransferase [Candidatus Neomarinimicrobiota bacterium]MBT3675949.1 GNAT family N-acetyltransferase [Candidatus Neomarinimicrobiota bacterium]MBT3762689.1 GNAT family N-acetyltransferase [Candidatus Neomarinimicrobiota bacterium]MBT4068329.1 GNAT family N-acetyltransferase [Candidatus Neomarinimicrobiota bacterium]MBT4271096.1 GNAT family N-acetyltransferase [Candidatus Neomarinimicrobiota bacterium]